MKCEDTYSFLYQNLGSKHLLAKRAEWKKIVSFSVQVAFPIQPKLHLKSSVHQAFCLQRGHGWQAYFGQGISLLA